jgi:polysaccharide pyruvyl transferase WcaK-like protein
MPVAVVPIARHGADSDVAAGHRLAEAMGVDTVRVLDEPGLGVAAVKGLVGQAFAAVGVSYHLCTFALSQGVPAVCLMAGAYYGQKGRGLAGFWGDETLALDVGQLDPHEAAGRVCATLDNPAVRDALRARAEQAVTRWKDVCDGAIGGMLAAARQAA